MNLIDQPASLKQPMMKAKVSVQLDHAFFAFLLSKYTINYTTDIPTAAVDQNYNLYFNPEFAQGCTSDQLVWTHCHELLHPILGHFRRQNGRETRRWNYATDAVINDILADSKVGKPVPGTVCMPGSRHKTAEQVYEELPANEQDESDGSASGKGSGNQGGSPLDNGMGNDLVPGKPLTPGEQAEVESQMKIDVTQAAMAARARGQLTGKLAEFVASIINVETKWYDILLEFMQQSVRGAFSWQRPNRRFTQIAYLPSRTKDPRMGTIVIQVDVSGSITPKEAQHYGGHMTEIVAQCQPEKVYVLYTDTEVKRVDEFEAGEEVEFQFMRGGGTDMTAGFRWCEDNAVSPDVFVTLTDGWTPFGHEQSFPVAWCITSDAKAPHGLNVPFKIQE